MKSNEKTIRQRIRQIKNLIGNGRMEAAFEALENFIADIDGKELEKREEQALQNQLVAIRNRFVQADKNLHLNPDNDGSDYNAALQAILKLVDKALEVALDDPRFAQQGTAVNFADASPTYTASIPIEKAQKLNSDGSENKGCMLAFANKSTNVNIEVKSFSFLRPILGLAGVLLISAIGFYALNKESVRPTAPIVKTEPPPNRDNGGKTVTESLKGKTGKEMEFDANSVESKMADYLSDPKSPKSKKFNSTAFSFAKNKVKLNAEGKAQLDQIAKVLKAYPDAYLEILGAMSEDEEASYRGSKEITLDEVRAKSARDYLLTKGVPADQLSFEGDGLSNQRGVSFRLIQ